MKRMVSIFAAALAAMTLLTGCGAKQPAPETTPAPQASVSMYDLSEAMRSAWGSESELAYVSSSDDNAAEELAYVTETDYEKVDSFFMLYAADGSKSADETVVIRMKDEADAQTAADTFSAHVKSRKALYDVYAPELAAEMDGAVIFTEGSFAVLIVGGNAEAAREAFSDFIDK